jgi:DNA helicase-2/ATP-dependent DNA helicase PcrA
MSKSPDGTKHLKDISKIKKQQSLAKIYTTYQQHLLENGYIDFSDMILRAIEIVETNADVRATLAETYQCIMIDEFQDTNAAQMRLVHAIASVAGESPNVFAVGDDAQGIYKFQ